MKNIEKLQVEIEDYKTSAEKLRGELAHRKENMAEIADLADLADNLCGASRIPMPSHIHLSKLSAGMENIGARLKIIYEQMTGTNPWKT